jgi:hypothetical protein
MHLRFDETSAVVSAPSSPERAAKAFRRAQGLVTSHGSGGDILPRLRVLAGRDDGMSAALGDRIMALAGVVGAVCRDAADLLARRYLAEKVGQKMVHRRCGFR